MRYPGRLALAAFFAAVALGGISSVKAADLDERAALAGRQKIREELAVAMSDGRLSRMEQYRILLDAKDVLTPQDLHGLQQTLDRLATASGTRTSLQKGASSDDNVIATRALMADGVPSVSNGPAIKAADGSYGPFIEEKPGDVPQAVTMDDDEMFTRDGSRLLAFVARGGLIDLELSTGIDAFKGPVDDLNANGNFGVRLGLNGAVPVAPRLGIGIQAGTNVILSDLKGTGYPGPNTFAPDDTALDSGRIRSQDFVTVGLFQRVLVSEGEGTLGWGVAYDWLFDNYYDNFTLGQWRLKAAYEISACNEIGVWATLRDRNSTGQLFSFGFDIDNNPIILPVPVNLQPIDQANFYWKHSWTGEASVTSRLGFVDQRGSVIFGADGRSPLTPQLALTGGFTYIMPRAPGGQLAQDRDIWNVSIGIEFVLGGFRHGAAAQFSPFMPVADNGILVGKRMGDQGY